jgi:hypothetical protein
MLAGSPSQPDPILALIERHREAAELEEGARAHFDGMNAEYPRESEPPRGEKWSAKERIAWHKAETKRSKGNPRDLAYQAWNDCVDAAATIGEEIISTHPTTIAGVAALAAYWATVATTDNNGRDFEATRRLLETLATAAFRLADGRSA